MLVSSGSRVLPLAAAALPLLLATACGHTDRARAAPALASRAALAERGCALGDGAACRDLGFQHEKGLGFPPDAARGMALYERACDLGDAIGCQNLAQGYEDANGVPEDPGRAATLFERACELGHADSCAYFAGSLEAGRGVARDAARARAWYETGCERRSGLACMALGSALDASSPRRAGLLEKGRALLEDECAAGQAGACSLLALVLRSADLGPPDPARADALQRRACELGRAASCAPSR